MFFKSRRPLEKTYESELNAVVTQALPAVDEDTQRIVVAVAGLFGCVSYADREFSAAEQNIVMQLLQTINGVGQAQAQAILGALRQNIVHVSTIEAPRYARTLMQLGTRDLRLHVLSMLLDVASVDHELTQDEVTFLRQITKSLGLVQTDYNDLQSQHRDKLAALK